MKSVFFALLGLLGCASRSVPERFPEHSPASTAAPEAPLAPVTKAFEEGAPEEQQAATRYVCPMHPEVVSDHPGECPRCGMDLEEVR